MPIEDEPNDVAFLQEPDFGDEDNFEEDLDEEDNMYNSLFYATAHHLNLNENDFLNLPYDGESFYKDFKGDSNTTCAISGKKIKYSDAVIVSGFGHVDKSLKSLRFDYFKKDTIILTEKYLTCFDVLFTEYDTVFTKPYLCTRNSLSRSAKVISIVKGDCLFYALTILLDNENFLRDYVEDKAY